MDSSHRCVGVTTTAWAVAICLAVLPASGQRNAIDTFERYLAALVREAGIPGLSAAVLVDGSVIWERGFGYADLERKIPARPDTPYPIASLTKTFTATLALRCLERGTLDLDEPIRRYSSLVPETAATVRHVLSHTSKDTPGARFEYDGDRYRALTEVVQACHGAPYAATVADAILSPLAMTRSVPGHDLEQPSATDAALFDAARLARFRQTLVDLALPYMVQRKVARRADYPPRTINASAGLISTVQDLARYDQAIDDHLLISETLQRRAWTPSATTSGPAPYGLGWFVQSHRGAAVVWHFGQWPQFSALYLKVPAQRLTLLLLANSSDLSSRFPLSRGDVTVSPFARAFLAAFVEAP
jgi:CubicO group peptidase (beta-lactamase class C family)